MLFFVNNTAVPVVRIFGIDINILRLLKYHTFLTLLFSDFCKIC